MTCAIFCLLAFCAFDKVSAMHFPPNWTSLESEFMQKLNVVNQRLFEFTFGATEAAAKQGVEEDDLVTCKVHGYAFNTRHVHNKYFQCLNIAKKINNTKLATECCRQNIAELEDREKGVRVRVMACIAKLVHGVQEARDAVRTP